MNISNKTFLITGVFSGLGQATALYLLEQNANVVMTDIKTGTDSNKIKYAQDRWLPISMDVTQQNQIEATLERAVNKFGRIDGLINCAGILVAGRLLKKEGTLFELDQFRHCLEVNLTGSFNMIRLICPILSNNPADKNGERGIIINTASIAAYEGQIGQVAYAASKTGIIGMTLPLARELAEHGIRVMTIAPGVFETPLFAEVSEKQRQRLEKQTPFPSRLGKATEYAALVQHIIENPMLNGEVIRLDGALRLT
jgi:NAD(P)-dependent dehydrogenase (short-subunit alcohol dehydrogenase family)